MSHPLRRRRLLPGPGRSTTEKTRPGAAGPSKPFPTATSKAIAQRAKYLQEKGLHEKGRANGYLLTYGDKRFYFSGASDDIPEIRALKNIDVALVRMRIGPYVDPVGAAGAALVFLPKLVIPSQYGDSDLAQFREKLDGTGVEVRVPEGYSP